MDDQTTDSAVHHAIVRSLIDQGRAPTNRELEAALGITGTEVEASLRRLDATHGLVLHPQTAVPWVVHPFATSPSLTWVEQGSRGWWAPCTWCALGVCALVGDEATIHTRLGGEAEEVDIVVRNGSATADLWVHFPEPPRLAWQNVHHFCARLLPFARREDVAPWAARHGFVPGEVVPIAQMARLAQRWYGRHADPNWKKWTIPEAAAIFHETGFSGPFWSLEAKAGTF